MVITREAERHRLFVSQPSLLWTRRPLDHSVGSSLQCGQCLGRHMDCFIHFFSGGTSLLMRGRSSIKSHALHVDFDTRSFSWHCLIYGEPENVNQHYARQIGKGTLFWQKSRNIPYVPVWGAKTYHISQFCALLCTEQGCAAPSHCCEKKTSRQITNCIAVRGLYFPRVGPRHLTWPWPYIVRGPPTFHVLII